MKKLLLQFIHLYQLIKPIRLLFFMPSCRFYPSCSAYATQAIQAYGSFNGLALTVKRLLRCHPFHSGGIDLVPPSPGKK
ncbi:MAG: membrane protein insertion efficiency factor YidD [Cyanobacteria bacterium P01_H01_bin.74]